MPIVMKLRRKGMCSFRRQILMETEPSLHRCGILLWQMFLILHGTTAAGWLNVRNTMTAGSRFPFMRQVWDSGNQEKSWWLLRKKRDIPMWSFIRLWSFWRMAQTDTLHLHTLQSAHVMAHQQNLQHWWMSFIRWE